jgi:hypothetical protein
MVKLDKQSVNRSAKHRMGLSGFAIGTHAEYDKLLGQGCAAAA